MRKRLTKEEWRERLKPLVDSIKTIQERKEARSIGKIGSNPLYKGMYDRYIELAQEYRKGDATTIAAYEFGVGPQTVIAARKAMKNQAENGSK